MNHTQKLLSALAFAALAVPAFAQSGATPRIDQRQANQQERIAAGAQSGALTPAETQHLEKQQARIEAGKEAAKADGKVSAAERARLTREQNHASHQIYRKKHNSRRVS